MHSRVHGTGASGVALRFQSLPATDRVMQFNTSNYFHSLIIHFAHPETFTKSTHPPEMHTSLFPFGLNEAVCGLGDLHLLASQSKTHRRNNSFSFISLVSEMIKQLMVLALIHQRPLRTTGRRDDHSQSVTPWGPDGVKRFDMFL